MLEFLAAAAGTGLIAAGGAGRGLRDGRAGFLGLTIGVLVKVGLGGVDVHGTATLGQTLHAH